MELDTFCNMLTLADSTCKGTKGKVIYSTLNKISHQPVRL